MKKTHGVVLIKLGGSVITDKRQASKPNRHSMHAIATELARRSERMILLNGAGSFGHIPVRRHRLDEGFSQQKKSHLATTKLQLLRLQEILISILCGHGIPAVPFSPSSFMVARSGRLHRVELAPLREFLNLGLVPVFGGDLVPDLEKGWTVVSADQMASWIAPRIRAKLLVYGTDVDGLYSTDPNLSRSAKLIQRISYRELRSIAKSVLGSRMPDVTAGMQGKLLEAEKAARKGVKVVIMNLKKPERLHSILDGRHGKWTTVVPRRTRLE